MAPSTDAKNGDDHPRSTVTWKNQGFKLDTTYNRVRLSKGTNMKESRYAADYILCEYTLQTDDGQTLNDVDSVQTVRAVWTGQQWELHFVCKMRIETPETPGENTAGVDLGICNTAAVSVGDETLLCPGNALKEDAHYFRREEYDTEVDLLSALKGEDSHGTAPLGWEFQGCRLVGMTGLLAFTRTEFSCSPSEIFDF